MDISDIPGGWNYELFRRSVASRQHLLPMFRWKALKVPFGLHHPVWVDDPDFDLDYHPVSYTHLTLPTSDLV